MTNLFQAFAQNKGVAYYIPVCKVVVVILLCCPFCASKLLQAIIRNLRSN